LRGYSESCAPSLLPTNPLAFGWARLLLSQTFRQIVSWAGGVTVNCAGN